MVVVSNAPLRAMRGALRAARQRDGEGRLPGARVPQQSHRRRDEHQATVGATLRLRLVDGFERVVSQQAPEAEAPLSPGSVASGATLRHRPPHDLEVRVAYRCVVKTEEAVDGAHWATGAEAQG